MNVLTMGTFDIFHVGHVNLLAACRKIAGSDGYVWVGLNTDQFIEKYKGERPINNYRDREKTLLALKSVTQVFENSSHDSRGLIELPIKALGLPVNAIVIGSDWATKDYYKQIGVTQKFLDDRKILMIYVPYTEGISSSQLRRHLAD